MNTRRRQLMRLLWYACCGAVPCALMGVITSYVPRYKIGDYDITWILGTAWLAMLGGGFGTIVWFIEFAITRFRNSSK
jgi:hypothetical protein